MQSWLPLPQSATGVRQKETLSKWPTPLVAQPVSVSSGLPLQASGTTGTEPNQAARSPCSFVSRECSIHLYAQLGCAALLCITVVSPQPVAPSSGMTLSIGLFWLLSKFTWNGQELEANTTSFKKSSTCAV